MASTPQSRKELLLELIKIPGVTASARENLTAEFIYGWLSGLDWFSCHPEYLKLIPTPLEGDNRPLNAVAALVTAAASTKKTIILTGHFDVVDTAVYGSLRNAAFEPEKLAKLLASIPLDEKTSADLASGNFLFGRGSMDMKCGVAVEMELLKDFAENRDLFNVNLLLLIVPDEENASAGMRGAAHFLAELQHDMGLEYLAAINAEPTEAGRPTALHPTIFLGTVGKLMPAFLCLGRESHVGAYYDGVNAALMSSHIMTLAEGNPELADPAGGECCPSWICLEQKILREGYSVTVPGAAIIFFNCYATVNTPADVLEQMKHVAKAAALETETQIAKSFAGLKERGLPGDRKKDWHIRVCSVSELREKAAVKMGEAALGERLCEFLSGLDEPDPREAGIEFMLELARLAGEDGPVIIYGFLPPYYPPRGGVMAGDKNEALARAADDLIAESGRQEIKVEKTPFFTGLCDLSYFGFQGKPEDLASLEKNMPGWGKIYSLPTRALSDLDVPIINFGPSGRDPHKKTERLELGFSLEQYPSLLEFLIRSITAENGDSGK